MRRLSIIVAIVAVAVLAMPLSAFAAHCVNHSKNPNAGNGIIVTIDVINNLVYIEGQGGYADVWIDVTGDGVGEFLEEEGIQIGKNHSLVAKHGNVFSADIEPWVNPGAINKYLKGNNEKGMGFPDEH